MRHNNPSRPYKLEIEKKDDNQLVEEKISFGPRQYGETGRDILVVRHALGSMEILQQTAPEYENKDHWLDCMTGKEISLREAATFDSTMETYLTKFQLDNQFYILSYLFSKFGIANLVEDKRGLAIANRARAEAAADFYVESPTGEEEQRAIDMEIDELVDTQLEVLNSLFRSEFGSLGEATLAVLHGWIPRTTVGNQSYHHDSRLYSNRPYAHDLVLRGLHQAFVEGTLAQNIGETSEIHDYIALSHISQHPNYSYSSDAPRGFGLRLGHNSDDNEGRRFSVSKKEYEDTTSAPLSFRDLLDSRHLASLSYNLKGKDEKSLLYSSFLVVSDKFPKSESVSTLSSQDYADAVTRIGEPDPLTDPDPFVISNTVMGFFYKTEYTLERLPPLKPSTDATPQEKVEYQSRIIEIEQLALYELLNKLNKPVLFKLDPTLVSFQNAFTTVGSEYDTLYGANNERRLNKPRESPHKALLSTLLHPGLVAAPGTWLLAPQPLIDTILDQTSDNPDRLLAAESIQPYTEIEYYPDLDNPDMLQPINNLEPLIKFVEFRFPSLRPGDQYRAKFLINRKKLDQIFDGLTESQLQNAFSDSTAVETFRVPESPPTGPSLSCDESPLTEAQQERRYEEYKALAAKARRSIARSLRESQLEIANKSTTSSSRTGSTSIDLGVFGNTDVNFGPLNLGGFSGSPEEFSNSVLKAGSSLLASPMETLSNWADKKVFGPSKAVSIQMAYSEIKDRVDVIAKDLREAYAACIEDKVKFTSNYDGNLEATKLENALAQLRDYIQKRLPTSVDFHFDQDSSTRLLAGALPLSLTSKSKIISINFTGAGSQFNMRITAGGHEINPDALKTEAPDLVRALTSIYFAQLYRMSGGSNMGSWWFNPFDLGNSELCSDLDLGKKGLAYLKRYTPDLDGVAKTYEPLDTWYEGNIKSPFVDWYDATQATYGFDTKNTFGSDAALKMFGKSCTVPKIFKEFIDRVSPGALLCDFLKCLNIPAFNLQIPDFKYPDQPDFSVFRWWGAAWKFFFLNFNKLMGRFLCTFARTIIDFLRVPWCDEVLRDQLYGEASSSTSVVQNAMVRGILDLGLDQHNADLAPDFIERAGLVLTNRELCRLLQGDPMDPASLTMLVSIAHSMGMNELDDEESVRRLFDHIGTFMPDGFCDSLQGADWLTTATTCEDTANALSSLRMRLLANDTSPEEIERVLTEAQGQLISQARAFELLAEQGITAVLPPVMDFSNPDAIINSLPKNLAEQTARSIKDLFEPAKMSYVTSLSAYGGAYYLNAFNLPGPDHENYDEESTIIVETILENFRLLQSHMRDYPQQTILTLQAQIHFLYQIYETTPYSADGPRILKLFKFSDGTHPAAHTDHPQHLLWPSAEGSSDFEAAAYDDRANAGTSKMKRLYPRPVGFSRNKFFLKDENNVITPGYPIDADGNPIFGRRNQSNISTWKFENDPIKLLETNGAPYYFVNDYKLIYKAVNDGDLEAGSEISLLQQILSRRLQELQGILSTYLPNISTPVPSETYLSIIESAMRASTETRLENAISADDTSKQSIYVGSESDAYQKLTIDFQHALGGTRQGPSISLYEYKSTGPSDDHLDEKRYDPYTITLHGDNLFLGTSAESPKTFRFCDAIVGPDNQPGENAKVTVEGRGDNAVTYIRPEGPSLNPTATQVFSGPPIPGGLYTRREIFARRHIDSIQSMVNKYDDRAADREDPGRYALERGLLNYESELRDELYNVHYPEFLEGIFEQVFFSLRNSRIYDETKYFDALRRRVAGQVFYNEIEECYKNRYNVSQFGVLSFEKLITDEIGKQLNFEMSRPENSFENVDYDDLGPIEKAIQNVCLIGFIRICLVELLLKGSLAYSVWDFEGVYDEPLMKDFVYEFVKHELERIPSIKNAWKPIITRVTGIEAPFTALRRLVHQQAIKMQDLSKNVYQNNPNIDYYRWFTKYFIPQSEVSRDISCPSTAREALVTAIFTDDEGNVIDTPLNAPAARFSRLESFYWQHPFKNETNIILNQEIESNGSGVGTIATARNHINGNDPFFHIEHALRVTGPLSALETMILPTREIIAAFTDADPVDSPELFTNVEDRTPEVLNIADSLARVHGLPTVDITDYRFKATPELAQGAAGSSIEEYEEGSSLDKREEIYHIDDFLGAINNALNEDDLDKYIKHMQGLYDFDEDPTAAPGGLAKNTNIPAADGYPYAIERTPTRFIKKTRTVVKFNKDFVSHGFGDFFDGDVAGSPLNSFHNWLKSGDLSDLGQFFPSSATDIYTELNNMITPNVPVDSYYIIAEDAKQLMNLRDLVDLNYNIQPGAGSIDEKSFDMASLIKGGDKNQTDLFVHLSESLEHSLTSGAPASFYDKIDINQHTAPPVVAAGWDAAAAFFDTTGNLIRTSAAPHMLSLPRSDDNLGITSGIQRHLLTMSPDQPRDRDRLLYSSALDAPGLGEIGRIIFENKLGEFGSKSDFVTARALHSPSPGRDDPYYDRDLPGPPQLSISPSRDEYWVETVYDFSGDASILAGLYGSFTIGDTFDPAVLHFEPEDSTTNAMRTFNEGVVNTLYDQHPKYDAENIKNSVQDGMLTIDLTANSRTFFTDSEGHGPYLIRPMGIDKFSNIAMTAPYLLTNETDSHGNDNSLFRKSPFSVSGRAHMYGYLRSAQSKNWPSRDAQSGTGENPAGFFGVANVQAINPRYSSCKILHLDDPTMIEFVHAAGQPTTIMLEAKKSKLLPPNIYPIPLRVLVTRVYVGNMTNPSEVYCRIVLPEYLENLKGSTSIATNPTTRVNQIETNIGKLNTAIKEILEGFTRMHTGFKSLSGAAVGAPSDLASLDQITNSNPDQPEWRASFPDFTQDYNGRSAPNEDNGAIYRSSAINPTSRVQYCSIERVYSKVFEKDASAAGRNSKEDLDNLFSNRGNLLRSFGPAAGIGLTSPNFYDTRKDDLILGRPGNPAGALNFHKSLRSLQSILDIFLRERRPDSLWGMLTAESVSPLSTSPGSGQMATLRDTAGPPINILPENIEDRTLKVYTNPSLARLRQNLEYPQPNSSFTQTAPLGLTLSVRTVSDIDHNRLAADADDSQLFIKGLLPSWSQALLPTVSLSNDGSGIDALSFTRSIHLVHPVVHDPTIWWKNLSPAFEIKAGFHQPYAIARSHNFFAFGADNMRMLPEGALQYDSSPEEKQTLAAEIDNIDYYFKGDSTTLIPRYGFGRYENNSYMAVQGVNVPVDFDERPDYSKSTPAQSGLITDGAGDYLVNYNRIPAIKMPSHQNASYYADGRISLADVTIYIRSVIKNALLGASRPGLVGEGLGGASLDALYSPITFFRNPGNMEVIRRIIQQNQSSEGDLDEDSVSFQVVSDPDDRDSSIYTRVYTARRPHSKPINSEISDKTFNLIMEFLSGLAVMVSKRYMYSVRTECDIKKGETDFTNPTAPFVLNFLIKVFQNIQDSSLTPEDKMAAFAAMSQYDLAQKLLVTAVNPQAGQEFQTLGFMNYAESPENVAAKVDWALACLYYMHIMLCWLSTSNTFEPLRLEDNPFGENSNIFDDLFYAICIRVPWNKAESGSRTYSYMLRLRLYQDDGYDRSSAIHNMAGDWESRVQQWRKYDIMTLGNHGQPESIITRLGNNDDKSMVIKPLLMREFIPWSTFAPGLQDGTMVPAQAPLGGIENLIRAVHTFHREVCNGTFGADKTFMRDRYGSDPSGILSFLSDSSTVPRDFQWPDFINADSIFYDGNNPDPVETWQRAFTQYSNASGATALIRKVEQRAEEISVTHTSNIATKYAEQERTTVFNGQLEDILLKIDYDMYNSIFYDNSEDSRPFINHLVEKGIADEDEQQAGPRRKANYDKAVLKVLYTSHSGIPRLAANSIYNIPETIQTAVNMKNHYMTSLNRATGIDQALSATVFDKALINLKEGLLKGSKIDQICRFVSNIPFKPTPDGESALAISSIAKSKILKKPSEEMRTGFMSLDLSGSCSSGFLSTPLAEHSSVISPGGEVMINCWPLSSFKEKYHLRQNNFAEILLRKGEVKPILEYIFPVKRFQAISTIYTTAMLSGYSTMPSILQAPKHNLAFLTKLTGLNTKERFEFLKNHSQAETMKSLIDNPVSDPKNIDCFDLAFPAEFFDNFKDMLKDLIKYFPSALMRGIASTIDPAYKEMKAHWEQCEIEELDFKGVRALTADTDDIKAGLVTPKPGKKGKYSMILPSAGRDMVYSIDSLLGGDTKPIARTLERTIGYLYKGPIALMDGVFAFDVPCLDFDEDNKWPGDSPKPWNLDRYGHPMSPFTTLALWTYQLPGDKKMRERSGACTDAPLLYTPEAIQENLCLTPEPAPFGGMPKPKDFE